MNTKYGRLATSSEQIIHDLLEEQKKTNELLSQLIVLVQPKEEPKKEEPKPKVRTTKRTRKKEGDK